MAWDLREGVAELAVVAVVAVVAVAVAVAVRALVVEEVAVGCC
jgi:hypothetical protein